MRNLQVKNGRKYFVSSYQLCLAIIAWDYKKGGIDQTKENQLRILYYYIIYVHIWQINYPA